jgi:hypothetical protein
MAAFDLIDKLSTVQEDEKTNRIDYTEADAKHSPGYAAYGCTHLVGRRTRHIGFINGRNDCENRIDHDTNYEQEEVRNRIEIG